ncbi:WD40 repeat-like protein, partial [Fistulina hepatica ATCC 64428]
EKERQANIARNKALFEQLELKSAVAQLGFPANKPASAKSQAKPVQSHKKRRTTMSPPERIVTRQSARLRNTTADPNESPAKKRKREAEEEEQRAREAEARLEAEERERIAKRPRHHDLDFKTLAEEEDEGGLSLMATTLSSVSQYARGLHSADREDEPTLGNKAAARAVEELRERLSKLKVVARAKVTQDRIYSADYHPERTKDLIFFGDKHGQLGIWDAHASPEEIADDDDEVSVKDQEGGRYWRLQPHWPATSKSSISCVKVDPSDAHVVYTSAYDCTIRSLTFTSGVSREIFAVDERVLISSLDLTPDGREMWLSDANGGVTHLDLRLGRSSARTFYLSDQKIGCVSINSTHTNLLLAASNSRSLKIWDVRMLQKIAGNSEVPTFDNDVVNEYAESKRGLGTLRGEWRHDKSVSAAYWDPSGTHVVSTSYDDRLRLWDFSSRVLDGTSIFPSMRPQHQRKHNCQTGRWVTIFKARWTANPNVFPHFTIGNMDHSLDIVSATGETIVQLADRERISAVQAVTCSHPNIVERAVSGNASGRCVLWAPVDD